MFSVAESVQAVEKNGDKLFTKELPRGRHCSFIKLSDGWGLKVYLRKDQRDDAHLHQTRAAVHGLGPETGPAFDVKVNEKDYFVYTTEVVETVYQGCYFYQVAPGGGESSEAHTQRVALIDKWQEEADELKAELDTTIGWDFKDSFPSNWGLKNGQLICIDFS